MTFNSHGKLRNTDLLWGNVEFDPGFNARQYTKFWRLKPKISQISIPYKFTNNKSSGPENITPMLLNNTENEIIDPLLHIL